MTDTVIERPVWACAAHKPPTGTRPWARADDGYTVCGDCAEKMSENLFDIAKRYLKLDPTPGSGVEHGGRFAPGFSARSPVSLHIVCMTDPRSSEVAKVWVAADGRVHRESERPPLSVYSELDTIAWTVAEARGYADGHRQTDVAGLCGWIDRQLDWVTRQPDVGDVARALRRLLTQLRNATGERSVFIGVCDRVIDHGEHTETCGARLHAPLKGDTIYCPNPRCDSEWPRSEWLRLGELLNTA